MDARTRRGGVGAGSPRFSTSRDQPTIWLLPREAWPDQTKSVPWIMPTASTLRFSPFPARFAAAAVAALAALALWLAPPLHAQDGATASLGLPERRALKQYQDTKLPELQKSINAAAKFELPLEVQWGAIAQKDQGASYLADDYFTNIYFVPLANALKGITADAMGAEALKAKLKKVVITYDQATAPASNYPNGVSFEGGTLKINFAPFSNSADVEPRAKAIQGGLESKL